MQLAVVVKTPHRSIRFICTVHVSNDVSERKLGPDFYKLGVTPEGLHHELEILEPRTWPPGRPIHHHAENGRSFICYPRPIPTTEKAIQLMHEWCVGTAYTIDAYEDFGPLYEQDPTTFLDRMRTEHKIQIVAEEAQN